MNASQLNKPEDINVNNKKTWTITKLLFSNFELNNQRDIQFSIFSSYFFSIAEAGNAFKYQLGL